MGLSFELTIVWILSKSGLSLVSNATFLPLFYVPEYDSFTSSSSPFWSRIDTFLTCLKLSFSDSSLRLSLKSLNDLCLLFTRAERFFRRFRIEVFYFIWVFPWESWDRTLSSLSDSSVLDTFEDGKSLDWTFEIMVFNFSDVLNACFSWEISSSLLMVGWSPLNEN